MMTKRSICVPCVVRSRHDPVARTRAEEHTHVSTRCRWRSNHAGASLARPRFKTQSPCQTAMPAGSPLPRRHDGEHGVDELVLAACTGVRCVVLGIFSLLGA